MKASSVQFSFTIHTCNMFSGGIPTEKFTLKWNDFQNNVSQSFEILRAEREFFDVTLVTEDECQVQAHKLVLAACSPFFKKVLRNNQHLHLHPLLYLSGVHSSVLKSVLDFIYMGEVSVEQQNLEQFLAISQKLKLKGLLLSEDDVQNVIVTPAAASEDQLSPSFSEKSSWSPATMPPQHASPPASQSRIDKPNIKVNPILKQSPRMSKQLVDENDIVGNEIVALMPDSVKPLKEEMNDQALLNKKIDALITREGNSKKYSCMICYKMLSDKTAATSHVETHFKEIVYTCDICSKTAKTRNGLRQHKNTYHFIPNTDNIKVPPMLPQF